MARSFYFGKRFSSCVSRKNIDLQNNWLRWAYFKASMQSVEIGSGASPDLIVFCFGPNSPNYKSSFRWTDITLRVSMSSGTITDNVLTNIRLAKAVFDFCGLKREAWHIYIVSVGRVVSLDKASIVSIFVLILLHIRIICKLNSRYHVSFHRNLMA